MNLSKEFTQRMCVCVCVCMRICMCVHIHFTAIITWQYKMKKLPFKTNYETTDRHVTV
jgi:hypothetical protein